MNKNMLKGKMRECDMSQETVANKIGLSLSRFNAKLNETRGAEFSLGEVRMLRDIFKLDEQTFVQIFFI